MLFTIAESVRSIIRMKDRVTWERDIESSLENAPSSRSLRRAISGPDEHFIFEIKRTSPSNPGRLVDLQVGPTARLYLDAGASAISVLTEPAYFGGSLTDLSEARQAVPIPLLRKDFIIDALQIREARAHGADAVLLIVALLSQRQLREFIQVATALRMDALVEVHTASELERALDAGPEIVGVNNRNLQTMEIDLEAGARLLSEIPATCVRVAESGLRTRADLDLMRAAGADAYLIGSSVVRSTDMQSKILELTQR